MPYRSDAQYFKQRGEVARAAAVGSEVRGAILVHNQMADEYGRLSAKAVAVESAMMSDTAQQ